jgi:uncharacterized protein YqeY
MSLQTRLIDEMKEAMKTGEALKVSVIRMLRASIKNREIEKGKRSPLTEQELLEVVSSAVKQRKDSIEQFSKGGRTDLVQKEQLEMDILKTFLPPALTKEELLNKARSVIQEIGATSPKDMGKVMKSLMPLVAGQADGAMVSEVVKDLLSTPKTGSGA